MAVALPEPYQHAFTPDESPASLDVIVPLLEELDAMPLETRPELDAFLAAWNETQCWLLDYVSSTRIHALRYTNDEAGQARWKGLVADVLPELSRWDDRLSRKFLASPRVAELEGGHYAPFLRKVRTDVELFREENVPLDQREQELCNEYQRISGTWSIDFDGAPRTMSAMFHYLTVPERDVREAAWYARADEIARTADELEELFEELFRVRCEIAANAGFASYRDYMFAAKCRDYDADACHNFARATRAAVLPLERELADSKARKLGLDTYRPWDHQAEPDGGAALTPFKETDELVDGVERMMRRLDPEFGAQFAAMRDHLDLDARPHKSQGGFMSWLAWQQRPFIFSNVTGKHSDVVTVLHEAGHAFHGIMAATSGAKPMGFGMHPPMEFNEVASMAQEILHYDTLDEFYDASDAGRAVQQHLRRVVQMFGRTMAGDQFQHWMYTNPTHTRGERRRKWVELNREFHPYIDDSGIDPTIFENGYHAILHFFVVPFYFIEYAFAQFGSLQVAMAASRDKAAALAAYKSALRLGPQKDVRGLYATAGADFDPTVESLGRAMSWIRERLVF